MDVGTPIESMQVISPDSMERRTGVCIGTSPAVRGVRKQSMKAAVTVVPAVLAFVAITLGLAGAEPVQGTGKQVPPKTSKPKQEQKAKVSSLTGCVDEQAGHYVLVDEHG